MLLYEPDGTPFDLRSATRVGTAVRTGHPQLRASRGIDHNYAPDGEGWRRLASLESARSRTRLDLFGEQPGVQVYTGNFLDGSVPATSGGLYRQGDGIALEPQLFPDSPNRPEWPSAQVGPGTPYRATLEWDLAPE